MHRVTVPALAFALLVSCGPGARPPAEPGDPPSIVAPVPATPVAADPGQPGAFEPLAGVAPAARAFVVAPEGAGVTGVLLVHAAWGVGPEMRALARELSRRGAVVVAPDLFDGVEVTSRLAAGDFVAGVDDGRAGQLLDAAYRRLAGDARLAGRPVAIVGLGPGGRWGLLLAGKGVPVAGAAFDSTALPPELPFAAGTRVLFLTGSASSQFNQQVLESMTAAAARQRIIVSVARIDNAGADVLDPHALGFSRTAYDEAVTALWAFLSHL
jgi:dienelactone hydrolase